MWHPRLDWVPVDTKPDPEILAGAAWAAWRPAAHLSIKCELSSYRVAGRGAQRSRSLGQALQLRWQGEKRGCGEVK